MTNGAETGTSGKNAFRIGPWGAIAIVSVPIILVNATSQIMDFRRSGLPVELFEPFLWEVSSAVVLVLLAPLVGLAVRRCPLEGPDLWRSILIHAALTLPFSAFHVLAIFLIRTGIYVAAGKDYHFFDSGVALTFIYEWRKDIISYAIFAAVYWGAEWLARRRRDAGTPAPSAGRIEVRNGGKTLFLPTADVLWLEAAGNYVEIHAGSAMHLVRGTLAAWEQKLAGQGFARIHRSRLVNRAHVAALKPTGSGDFEVSLSSGATVQGSRRFRSAFA